jgi:hypothetical protein
MSHFGRAGPPDIRDTYSLLVLNITFRTWRPFHLPHFLSRVYVLRLFGGESLPVRVRAAAI